MLLGFFLHIKPLAAAEFVAVDVECVPFEATVNILSDDPVCQMLNELKLKYLDSNLNIYFLTKFSNFYKKIIITLNQLRSLYT